MKSENDIRQQTAQEIFKDIELNWIVFDDKKFEEIKQKYVGGRK